MEPSVSLRAIAVSWAMEVAIGSDRETARTIEEMGGAHQVKATVKRDSRHKVAPLLLYGDATISQIYGGKSGGQNHFSLT